MWVCHTINGKLMFAVCVSIYMWPICGQEMLTWLLNLLNSIILSVVSLQLKDLLGLFVRAILFQATRFLSELWLKLLKKHLKS